MKRDPELIRALLLDAENAAPRVPWDLGDFEHWKRPVVIEHIELLIEAGFVRASIFRGHKGVEVAHIERLTWKGHEFLAGIKNDAAWNKAKRFVASKVGGLSYELLAAYLKHEGKRLIGIENDI